MMNVHMSKQCSKHRIVPHICTDKTPPTNITDITFSHSKTQIIRIRDEIRFLYQGKKPKSRFIPYSLTSIYGMGFHVGHYIAINTQQSQKPLESKISHHRQNLKTLTQKNTKANQQVHISPQDSKELCCDCI
jgi:hypothetical protein